MAQKSYKAGLQPQKKTQPRPSVGGPGRKMLSYKEIYLDSNGFKPYG